MGSLRSLTEQVEVGDHFAWVAQRAFENAGERTAPNTVTDIEYRGDTIRVYADGPRTAKYYYDVDPDGSSKAYYVNQQTGQEELMGPVVFAELTDSDEAVPVRRGFYDSRR